MVAYLISSVSTGLAIQNFYYKSFVVDPVGEFAPNQNSNIEVRITITNADVLVYREVHYAVSSNNDGIDDSDNATAISSGILRFNSTTNKVQVFVSGTGWIDLH